ncbi:MAG: 50S ribosomal protein L24 [Patescibacteria group bacterium]|nr:50S ribosomal protein L24 [Patescibacteria group bacterium]
MKFKINDTIKVTLGKDRGKTGKIEAVLIKSHRVVVPGINIYKKHLKKQGDKQPGGILEFPRPLALSKIALICPQCHLPTRIGFEGFKKKKVRICKKCRKPL